MKFGFSFSKLCVFTVVILYTSITNATETLPSEQTKTIKQVTVVNDSELYLVATAEGVSEGCVGGSLPPFLDPIKPHTHRTLDVVLIQYLPSCRFTVLPYPNIITALQACHEVKANDNVVFSGRDILNLRCHIG